MPFQVEHLRMPEFMFKNYFGNVYTHTPTKPFMLMTCDLSILHLGFAFRMGVNPGSCWACQTHPHLKQSVTIFAVSKSRLLFLEAHLRIWLSWKMLNKTLNCVGSNPASASHEDAQSVCFIPSRYPTSTPVHHPGGFLFQVTVRCRSDAVHFHRISNLTIRQLHVISALYHACSLYCVDYVCGYQMWEKNSTSLPPKKCILRGCDLLTIIRSAFSQTKIIIWH